MSTQVVSKGDVSFGSVEVGDSFYLSYHHVDSNIVICADMTGRVHSVENVGDTLTYEVVSKELGPNGFPIGQVDPGCTFLFGGIQVRPADLSFTAKPLFSYDAESSEYQDCND